MATAAKADSWAGLPQVERLVVPTINALKELGGSASSDELDRRATEILALPDALAAVRHKVDDPSRSEICYRPAWARTCLKNVGLIENSGRGVWALKSADIDPNALNPKSIVAKGRGRVKPEPSAGTGLPGSPDDSDSDSDTEDCRSHLYKVLIGLKPDQFERLTMRVLRESGFSQVVVTGRSGDGGVDGKGIVRVSGVVAFQWSFSARNTMGPSRRLP